MAADDNITIFNALRYSGENFFDNKRILDEIRQETTTVLTKAKEDYNNIKEKLTDSWSSGKQKVNDLLFDSLKFEESPKIEYDSRRECTETEYELIQQACQEKSETDIEDIKYALGFRSKNKSNLEYKKPCVAVVGQTKSGKSSLINALLREEVVPQKVSRQTARVTYLTYCETNFVAYLKNSYLVKIKVDEMIKEDDVDLKFEDRRKTEQVNIEVRVGTNNVILQNGFDIVDSPGLNENPALNDLCKKMEKSLLPLLIYVVDGRNGLTETDSGDIKSIMEHTPQLRIIYFVTKLDRSVIDRAMYQDRKKKSNMKENEDIEGESDVDVAERRLKNVFLKLQKKGFVSATQQFYNCVDFNGANLSAVHQIRKHQGDLTNPIDIFTRDRFKKFESNLMIDLKHMIEEPLKKDITSVRSTLENILEKTTTIASNYVNEKREKLQSLSKFELGELSLFNDQMKSIELQLREQINQMLDQYEKELLKIVEFHQYERKRELSQLHRHRSNQNKYFEMLGAFRFEIKDVVETSLKAQVKEFIVRFLQINEDNLRTELKKLVNRLSEGSYGRSSFEEMLKNRLYYDYDLSEESCVGHGENYMYQPKKRKKINDVINSCKEFLNRLNYHEPRHAATFLDLPDPQDKEWKENVAKNILAEFNREKFLDNICSKVTRDLNESHETFVNSLNLEKNFLSCDLNVGGEEKDCLKEFSEDLAILYARSFIVLSNISIVINPMKQKEFLNQGGQAMLEKVYVIHQNEALVKKTYHTVFKSFKESIRLKSIGLEVYYTSRLNDPRFLPLLGIKMESTNEGLQFSSFYPYKKLGSLKDYLDREKDKVGMKTRVKLALDIAGGIQHLHRLNIIHRDITLKNMLIDEKDGVLSAVIADYGVLNSLGFANRTKVGTPFYMASEIYNQFELKEIGYTFASDVFSFGVTLWQLLSYNLCDEYNNFAPRFVLECDNNDDLIHEKMKNGAKPERRDRIPEALNQMLDRCWELETDLRPSFVKPMNEILLSCDENDAMKTKTICDVLSEVHKSL